MTTQSEEPTLPLESADMSPQYALCTKMLLSLRPAQSTIDLITMTTHTTTDITTTHTTADITTIPTTADTTLTVILTIPTKSVSDHHSAESEFTSVSQVKQNTRW